MNNRAKIGAKVTKESLARVQKQLQEVSDQIDSRLKQAISETAVRIHGDAVRNAPVRTGSLKTSYQVDLNNIQKDEASVYTEIEYAPMVEYGIRQRPQPHFNPAVDKHMERFYKAVDKLIEQSVK